MEDLAQSQAPEANPSSVPMNQLKQDFRNWISPMHHQLQSVSHTPSSVVTVGFHTVVLWSCLHFLLPALGTWAPLFRGEYPVHLNVKLGPSLCGSRTVSADRSGILRSQ